MGQLLPWLGQTCKSNKLQINNKMNAPKLLNSDGSPLAPNISTTLRNKGMAERYKKAWTKLYSEMNEQMQATIMRDKGAEFFHPDVRKFIKEVISLAESDAKL